MDADIEAVFDDEIAKEHERNDKSQKWYFTFGSSHDHGDVVMSKRYVVVEGTMMEARKKVYGVFGNKWAFQYANGITAGIDRFALQKFDVSDGR